LPFYTRVPLAKMFQKPAGNSEVVSETFLGEEVHLLDKKRDWNKIRTASDHYEGWVSPRAIHECHSTFPSTLQRAMSVCRLAAHLYSSPKVRCAPLMTLPFESRLEVIEQTNESWTHVLLPDGKDGYIQTGDLLSHLPILTQDQLCTLSSTFLGLPYTWGGRSSFGYDCSGFVQMLYRQMQIFLPRDSKDQAIAPILKPIPVDLAPPGALIFFGKTQIPFHVGIVLGNNSFMHATVAENQPFIRTSSLDDPLWSAKGPFPYRFARKLP